MLDVSPGKPGLVSIAIHRERVRSLFIYRGEGSGGGVAEVPLETIILTKMTVRIL